MRIIFIRRRWASKGYRKLRLRANKVIVPIVDSSNEDISRYRRDFLDIGHLDAQIRVVTQFPQLFSLFALKIVLNELNPTDGMQYGQMLAAGSWFELILSSLFNKYSSWMSIAVGLAIGYEYTKGIFIKSIVDAIDGVIGLVLEMTGFAEDIERAAENWNDRDDGQANPNAGRGGMFGMGMGGMGMGMGGMGMGGGMFGPRYRARRW